MVIGSVSGCVAEGFVFPRPENVLRVGRLGLFASPAAGDSEKPSGFPKPDGQAGKNPAKLAGTGDVPRNVPRERS